MRGPFWILLSLVLASGCPAPTEQAPDSGTTDTGPTDAGGGTDAGADAGSNDAGPDAGLACPVGLYRDAGLEVCAGNPVGSHFQDVCASCADCVPYGPSGEEKGRCAQPDGFCLKPCVIDADCVGGRLPAIVHCEQIAGGCYCGI